VPDDKPKPYVVGTPICDECGKNRPIIITILERKETAYGYELVKRNLCVYHFAIMIDTYDDKYPDEVPDEYKKDDDDEEPDKPENPDDDDDNDDSDFETNVLCENKTCIWNEGKQDGECERCEIKLIDMGSKDELPLFTCDSYVNNNSKVGKIIAFIYGFHK
jgi:hypothetical protein